MFVKLNNVSTTDVGKPGPTLKGAVIPVTPKELVVQVYTVLVTEEVNPIVTKLPEQVSIVATFIDATGIGLTVIVYMSVSPGQFVPCVVVAVIV